MPNSARFSKETTGNIAAGVLTQKTREEVVNSLSTLMLVYTIRPTPNDYNIICKRLVDKHPTLKDHAGSGYVSVYVCVVGVYTQFRLIYC